VNDVVELFYQMRITVDVWPGKAMHLTDSTLTNQITKSLKSAARLARRELKQAMERTQEQQQAHIADRAASQSDHAATAQTLVRSCWQRSKRTLDSLSRVEAARLICCHSTACPAMITQRSSRSCTLKFHGRSLGEQLTATRTDSEHESVRSCQSCWQLQRQLVRW
jgi:hypothetical protein